MSTATLEQPPVVETPPVKGSPENGILAMVQKANAGHMINEAKKTPPAKVETPAPPVPKEEKPSVVVSPTPVQDDKEKNFAELRKAREAAEATAKELQEKYEALAKEHETYKVRPDPTEVEKEREMLNARLKELQTELKAAAVTRDKEFQAQYDVPIQRKQEQIISLLRAGGVAETDAATAVAQWNKGKFNEWIPDLPPLQQGQLAALIQGAEETAFARQDAIANAEKTYEEREKQKRTLSEQEQAKFRSGLKAEAEEVARHFAGIDGVKDHPELVTKIQAAVHRAAPLSDDHMSRKEVFQHVATSVMFAHIAQEQQTTIDALKAEKEEMQKKLDEQAQFISARNGSAPKPGEGNGIRTGTGEDSPLVAIMKKFNTNT